MLEDFWLDHMVFVTVISNLGIVKGVEPAPPGIGLRVLVLGAEDYEFILARMGR